MNLKPSGNFPCLGVNKNDFCPNNALIAIILRGEYAERTDK